VSSVPTDDGGHRIIAHVVLDGPTTVGELRRGLAGRIPPYAIPRAFFRVDEVPHTISGKVDRAWLRESAVGALPLETEYVAPRDDREAAVAQLFCEVLATERVGVHDDFFELGGDSLAIIELQAALTEMFTLELSTAEVLDDATVAGLARRTRSPQHPQTSLLVRVNKGLDTPLVCVSGAANSPLQLRPLARRMPNVDIRAFAYHGMDHRALPDRSVAAMARRNVRELRASRLPGPHRLFGYSFGGLVALEMANELVADGGAVELLVLLEPPLQMEFPSLYARGVSRAKRTAAAASRDPSSTTVDVWLDRARSFARDGIAYSMSRARLASAGIVARQGLAQHDVFFTLHGRMLRKHHPRPYRGATLLIGSSAYLDAVAPAAKRLLPNVDNGGRRHDLALASGHDDLLREPTVAELARILGPLLAQTWQAEQ
jgi:thioesterase domain-containing protein/acyl carrier protein